MVEMDTRQNSLQMPQPISNPSQIFVKQISETVPKEPKKKKKEEPIVAEQAAQKKFQMAHVNVKIQAFDIN